MYEESTYPHTLQKSSADLYSKKRPKSNVSSNLCHLVKRSSALRLRSKIRTAMLQKYPSSLLMESSTQKGTENPFLYVDSQREKQREGMVYSRNIYES